MPSPLHEVLLELFENQPALAARLLAELGLLLPEHERADSVCADLTDKTPTEYRADRVVTLSNSGCPVLAVIVEVQLRPDEDKVWVWPVYVATLRARLRCPVVLLVLTPDRRTADWVAQEIDLGFGTGTMLPKALGPAQTPMVTSAASAVDMPEMAVLSAIAHRHDPDRDRVFEALLAGLDNLARNAGSEQAQRAKMYYDLVFSTLPRAARTALEALMTTAHREYLSATFKELVAEGHEQGVAEGREQGVAEGRIAEAIRILCSVLDERGFDIAEAVRSRVEGCEDLEQLETWTRRAITAASIDDLFR